MPDVAVDLVECPQCKRRVRAGEACLYCGAKASSAARPVPAGKIEINEHPLLELLRPACPVCGGDVGERFVAIETWEYVDTTLLTGKTRHLVRSLKVPGVCTSCHRGIGRKQILASFVVVLPFVLICAAIANATSGFTVPLMVMAMYALHLLKWTGYTWADAWLYGFALEMDLAKWVPRGKADLERIRFPVGWLHALGRLALIPTAAMVGLAIGSLFA